MVSAAPQRIHIVGGPGSGKTTLAAALAWRLGLSADDLDDVALTEGTAADFRPLRALALRELEVVRLSNRPSWVTEGSYLWWTDALFDRAQAIVWLDIPWAVAARRILMRHVRTYVSDIACATGIRSRLRVLRHPHARYLLSFLQWSSRYYTARAGMHTNACEPDDMRALTRAATSAHLGRYRSKVVRLRRGEVEQVIAALEQTASTSGLLPSPADPAPRNGAAP